MSLFKNASGVVIPVRERREATGLFNVNGAEVIMPVNGDANVTWGLAGTSFVGTVEWAGSLDGTNFLPLAAWPNAVGAAGGTFPVSGQPIVALTLAAIDVYRTYVQRVGQYRLVRCRVTAYVSGSLIVTANAGVEDSALTSIDARPSTLIVSTTGAVGAAVTASLNAVTGLRHIIDFIQVTRSATAALTASATPVVVTTTNLPGSLAMTFGSDVAGIGIDKDVKLDFGSSGLAASLNGTVTTVACPAYVGVIWRINAAYRLGL